MGHYVPASRSYQLLTFVILIFLASVAVEGQVPKDPLTSTEQTLQAVLREIQALRVVTERSNRQELRALITLERIRIQREHLDRLARQLADLQRDLSTAISLRDDDINRLKIFTENPKTNPDEIEKDSEVIKELRADIQQKHADEQVVRDQVSQLSLKLQIEQTTLEELYKRIETLEAEIGVPKAKDEKK